MGLELRDLCLRVRGEAAGARHQGAGDGPTAKGTDLFNRSAKVLNDQLTGRKFVAGDALTLADFSIGAGINLAEMAHYPVEPYREIKRWYPALRELPAWQKTLAQTAPPA